MTPDYLKNRTKQFGLAVIRLVESLPKTLTAGILGKQILRSATSVGANYRAVCRARSKPDFIAKLGIVEEEIDESGYWLELLVDASVIKHSEAAKLLIEVDELTAIVVASRKTALSSKAR